MSPFARALAVSLLGSLATGGVSAQDVSPPRFGLGVTGLGGWLSANPAFFVGFEGFVRVAGGSFWSARVDGGLFPFAKLDTYGCIIPDPAPACDTRQLGKLGMLTASLVVGPRTAKALRPVYAVLGVGIAATRWASGAFRPPSNSGAPVEPGVGAGPTTPVFNAGIGFEFPLAGRNRIELRLHRFTQPGINGGRGASFAIGREW
jgi:hypothetical protein